MNILNDLEKIITMVIQRGQVGKFYLSEALSFLKEKSYMTCRLSPNTLRLVW